MTRQNPRKWGVPRETSEIDLRWFPRQVQALKAHVQSLLFGGASEGGKTAFIKLSSILWSSNIQDLNTVIFRKFYKEIVESYQDGNFSYAVILRPWIRDKIVKLTENTVYFERTNSIITLAQLRTDEDAEKQHGGDKPLMYFDEATFMKQRHMQEVGGWNRMPRSMQDKLPEQIGHLFPEVIDKSTLKTFFPRKIYTANPVGESVGYFRKQFVQSAAPNTIFRSSEKEGNELRIYIPSRIDDNPEADKVAQSRRLATFGAATARALIQGVWDAPTGDYFKEYDDELHTCENFTCPEHWFKFVTFDWGTHEPFFFSWWGVSDGEEFTDNGRLHWYPRGALILYREWNGCDLESPGKGLPGVRNADMAKGCLVRSAEDNWSRIVLTDSFPFQDKGFANTDGKKYMISDLFADYGLPLTKGNTARKHGWSQLRDRLIGIPDGSGGSIPMIYFQRKCIYVREYLPALPYDAMDIEDAAKDGEATHSCDTVRLACTARPLVLDIAPSQPPVVHGNIELARVLKMVLRPSKRLELR